jgi:hypothetical protein
VWVCALARMAKECRKLAPVEAPPMNRHDHRANVCPTWDKHLHWMVQGFTARNGIPGILTLSLSPSDPPCSRTVAVGGERIPRNDSRFEPLNRRRRREEAEDITNQIKKVASLSQRLPTTGSWRRWLAVRVKGIRLRQLRCELSQDRCQRPPPHPCSEGWGGAVHNPTHQGSSITKNRCGTEGVMTFVKEKVPLAVNVFVAIRGQPASGTARSGDASTK